MKVLIEFDIEIDGHLAEGRIPDVLLEAVTEKQVILSENVDGTDEWAISIEEATEKKNVWINQI